MALRAVRRDPRPDKGTKSQRRWARCSWLPFRIYRETAGPLGERSLPIRRDPRPDKGTKSQRRWARCSWPPSRTHRGTAGPLGERSLPWASHKLSIAYVPAQKPALGGKKGAKKRSYRREKGKTALPGAVEALKPSQTPCFFSLPSCPLPSSPPPSWIRPPASRSMGRTSAAATKATRPAASADWDLFGPCKLALPAFNKYFESSEDQPSMRTPSKI